MRERTDEERSAGLGEVVEAVAAEDVADHEREHEHGDLQQDPHPCHLLLLAGRGGRGRGQQHPVPGRRRQGHAQLQRHPRRRETMGMAGGNQSIGGFQKSGEQRLWGASVENENAGLMRWWGRERVWFTSWSVFEK